MLRKATAWAWQLVWARSSRCPMHFELMAIVQSCIHDRTYSYSRNRDGPSRGLSVIQWGPEPSVTATETSVVRTVTSISGARLFNHKTQWALHWTWHSHHQGIIWGVWMYVFKSHLLKWLGKFSLWPLDTLAISSCLVYHERGCMYFPSFLAITEWPCALSFSIHNNLQMF